MICTNRDSLTRRAEANDDDVAVLNGVVLAFQSAGAGPDRRLFPAVFDHRLMGNDLEADEALLHLGVDLPRGDRCGVSGTARPDVNFALPGGEEVDQAELAIRCADDARGR